MAPSMSVMQYWHRDMSKKRVSIARNITEGGVPSLRKLYTFSRSKAKEHAADPQRYPPLQVGWEGGGGGTPLCPRCSTSRMGVTPPLANPDRIMHRGGYPLWPSPTVSCIEVVDISSSGIVYHRAVGSRTANRRSCENFQPISAKFL